MENKKQNNSFEKLIHAVENHCDSMDTHSDDFGIAVHELAKAIAHSRTKTIESKTADRTVKALKNEIEYEDNRLWRMINSDVSETTQRTGTYTGNADALVNEIALSLLEYINEKMTAGQPVRLTEVFTIRQPKKRVLIKDYDGKVVFEDKETTAIQQAFKRASEYIHGQNNINAMATAKKKKSDGSIIEYKYLSGYTYIEDMAHDDESDTEEMIYRRLPKYADCGSYVMDFNGSYCAYTADNSALTTWKTIDDYISLLKLTDRQKTVLKLAIEKNAGQRAIATYLNVSTTAVQKTLYQIRKKAIDSGLYDEWLNAVTESVKYSETL